MKKYYYLIVLALILGLVLTGCSLLSNVGQVPTTNQSGITYLTKGPAPGLVGLWHFDGDADDSSVYGNDGIISGATDAGSANAMFGNALSFDGIGYVEVSGSTSMNVSSSYTFEAWINLSGENEGYCGFFRRGDLSTSDSEIEIYTQDLTHGRKLTVAHNRGGAFCYNYFTAFPVNQWIHLVVTWDGTSLKAYYNNVEQSVIGTGGTSSSIVSPATSGPAEPNYIGVGYNTVYMKGIIDEVRIWNGALTEAQIEQSYVLGTAQPPEGAMVVELGEELFPDDQVVIFTSSFYGLDAICANLDTVDIYMMSNYGETISGVSPRNKLYTPNKTFGCIELEGTTHEGISTSIEVGKVDCKSIHLSLDLTSERSVGFNAQFLPYD